MKLISILIFLICLKFVFLISEQTKSESFLGNFGLEVDPNLAPQVNSENIDQPIKFNDSSSKKKLKSKRQGGDAATAMTSSGSDSSVASSSGVNTPAGSSTSSVWTPGVNGIAGPDLGTIKQFQIKKWQVLFKNPEKRPSCALPDMVKLAAKKEEETKKQYLHNPLPRPAESWDEKKFGFGQAAYFFDYIDICWRATVVAEFNRMFTEAKAITDTPEHDPYSIENQLKYYNSAGMESKINQDMFYEKTPFTKQLMENTIVKINPKFNLDTYLTGISIPQLRQIISAWNWVTPKIADYADPAKHLVDKYDFDGNGKLDAREFTFLTIRENKHILGKGEPYKNTYTKFIDEVLHPFFTYADCDGDGLITSENIWKSAENLACRSPDKHDIYKCQAKTATGESQYRTSSTNDLVLKNSRKADGHLDKDEFYSAILKGFWDRQATPRGIINNNDANLKSLRWGGQPPLGDGTVDLECDQIMRMIMANK